MLHLFGPRMRVATCRFTQAPNTTEFLAFVRLIREPFGSFENMRITNSTALVARETIRNWIAWGDVLLIEDPILFERFENAQTMFARYIRSQRRNNPTDTPLIIQSPPWSASAVPALIAEIDDRLPQHIKKELLPKAPLVTASLTA